MNKSILVARLTADPELRTTPNGVAVTRITVAVNRIPNANGERVADFINVVVWRKQAENVAKYCTKGSLLGIEGRLQSSSYDGQDGKKKYITEVVADNVTFLSSAKQVQTNTQSTAQPVQVQAAVKEDPFSDFGQEVIINEEDLPWLQ